MPISAADDGSSLAKVMCITPLELLTSIFHVVSRNQDACPQGDSRSILAAAVVVGLLYVPFLNRGRIPIGSLGPYVQSFRFDGPVFAALDQLAPPQLLAGLAVPQRAKAKSLLTSDTGSDNILPNFSTPARRLPWHGPPRHSTPCILGQFAHLIDPGKLESGL